MPETSGLTALSEKQATAINVFRDFEARANGILDELVETTEIDVDQRLRAMAASHLEIGFMLLTKAVARPERRSIRRESGEVA